jgi:MSHA biogenesis protein MshL
MRLSQLSACGLAILLAACESAPVVSTQSHIQRQPARVGSIPPPVSQVIVPPPPRPAPKPERYSVVVNSVKVQELLFALARDAKINIDVHPAIEGVVTLNAIDQTLPQILARIAKQVEMRYEIDGNNLAVVPDTPFLRNYKVDYVNIARTSGGQVSISTQVATTGQSTLSGGGSTGSNNGSTTTVTNTSNNRFWDTLVQNIKDILRETDKVLPEGSAEIQTERHVQKSASGIAATQTKGSAKDDTLSLSSPSNASELQGLEATTTRKVTYREAASVIANPEAGVISVRATSRQHEKIQEFLDRVVGSAKRQVLIEATIVEVTLSEAYQAGVDWQHISSSGNLTVGQSLISGNFATTPVFTLGYVNPAHSLLGNINATVKLLSQFGNTKILSSPKIMALNNQTALLKVVDERVFFTIDLKVTEGNTNTPSRRDISSTVHTVPVGLVMSVTPQVGDANDVSLNVRPTISRISNFVSDPAVRLIQAELGVANVIDNRVPEIQVREMESILRVDSGQIIVLGGLMQDQQAKKRDGVPGVSKIPAVGDVFSFRDDLTNKTELVIFLRPIVTREASLDTDLAAYRRLLPDDNFFRSAQSKPTPKSRPSTEPTRSGAQ